MHLCHVSKIQLDRMMKHCQYYLYSLKKVLLDKLSIVIGFIIMTLNLVQLDSLEQRSEGVWIIKVSRK